MQSKTRKGLGIPDIIESLPFLQGILAYGLALSNDVSTQDIINCEASNVHDPHEVIAVSR